MPRPEIPRARLNRVWELAKRIEQIEGIAMSPAAIAAIDAALTEPGTPPDPAPWQPTTALELVAHLQRGHDLVKQDDAFECSCGLTFRFLVPPEGSPERQTS